MAARRQVKLWQWVVLVLGALVLVGVLAGGGDDASDDPSAANSTSTPSGDPTPACDRAFATAASVDPLRDTVSDLHQPAKACRDLADWSAASAANPGAIAASVDPALFAYNMCSAAPTDVAASVVCQEAIAADPLGLTRP